MDKLSVFLQAQSHKEYDLCASKFTGIYFWKESYTIPFLPASNSALKFKNAYMGIPNRKKGSDTRKSQNPKIFQMDSFIIPHIDTLLEI